MDKDEIIKNMNENALTITITEASDGDGYFYAIYDCEADQVEDAEEIDGGQCTGSIKDALGMAYAQANDLLAD